MARLKMRLLWLGKASLVLVTVAILAALGHVFLVAFMTLASADAGL
jgi:hypothetical protein